LTFCHETKTASFDSFVVDYSCRVLTLSVYERLLKGTTMPRMDNMEFANIQGMQQFQFSAVRIDHLNAVEYTLVTIAVDVSGSVDAFAPQLLECIKTAVESCKKSPRSNNLLLRVILFSTKYSNRGIEEVHGFKPLGEIDPNAYPALMPSGGTPLFDATFSSVGATHALSAKMMKQDYLVNAICFVITDGDDTASGTTPSAILAEIKRAHKQEEIESMIGIVIGINAQSCKGYLEKFCQEAELRFIDAGDATKGKLAKLADFVSQSVSSQSQALGTGGPSKAISATI
jgi:uncharacterized protein YegL